jgi:uncharacterized membrane protein YgdD (TMEM256/DUF423 family)
MVDKQFLIIGATLCLLAIVLGAFGAHGLKSILTKDSLESFETGVRYQFFTGFTLLVIVLIGKSYSMDVKTALMFITIGGLLFSFSIYGLTLREQIPFSVKFLGPITPIGGMLIIIGWIVFLINIAKHSFSQ